jgi:hypothetical protein
MTNFNPELIAIARMQLVRFMLSSRKDNKAII